MLSFSPFRDLLFLLLLRVYSSSSYNSCSLLRWSILISTPFELTLYAIGSNNHPMSACQWALNDVHKDHGNNTWLLRNEMPLLDSDTTRKNVSRDLSVLMGKEHANAADTPLITSRASVSAQTDVFTSVKYVKRSEFFVAIAVRYRHTLRTKL